MSLEGDYSGWPSTSKTAENFEICQLVHEDHCQSMKCVALLALVMGLDKKFYQKFRHASCFCSLSISSLDQKQWCWCMTLKFLTMNPHFISRVIMEESLLYDHNPETKHSSQWKEPVVTKAKEGTASQKQNKMHACHVLWHQRHHSRICSSWFYSELWFLLWSFEVLQRK